MAELGRVPLALAIFHKHKLMQEPTRAGGATLQSLGGEAGQVELAETVQGGRTAGCLSRTRRHLTKTGLINENPSLVRF